MKNFIIIHKKIFIFSFMIYLFIFYEISGAVFNLKEGHFDIVNDVVKHPYNNTLLTCSNDETLILWDPDKNKIIKTFELYKGALTVVNFSPNGQYFGAGSKNGTIFIFDFETKKMVDSYKFHSGKISAIVFGDTDNIVISSGTDNLIYVYDIEKKSMKKNISMPSKIMSMEISPDRKILAAGDDTGNIYLITLNDFSSFVTIKRHKDWVSGIAFSPDSKKIASINWNYNLDIYSIFENLEIKTIKLPTDKPLNSVKWSIDNHLIAISSSDSNIYIYDTISYDFQAKLSGHKKNVFKAIFFPDSNGLVSVSGDATVKIWDIQNLDFPQVIKSYSGY